MQLTRVLRKQITNESKLVMVAILHRHGDRAPIREHLYPNSANWENDYFPVGEGNLTNAGKKRLYGVGKKLRKRYDSFLGPYYLGHEVRIVTSTIQRTKMSVLALCAGLFPPQKEQIWNENFQWQPIVYTEIKRKDDCLIRGPGSSTFPVYYELYQEALKSDFNKKLVDRYSKELQFIGKYAGYKAPRIRDAYYLYQSLRGEESMGQSLPSWAKDIYPHKLEAVGVHEYDLATLTIPLRQYAGGMFAKHLVEQFENRIKTKAKRKFFIFSGHESTIGYQLRLLGIRDPYFPKFGSQIMWELHESNGEYVVKILYDNDPLSDNAPKQLLCLTYEAFVSQLKPNFPPWDLVVSG